MRRLENLKAKELKLLAQLRNADGYENMSRQPIGKQYA